MNRFFPPALTSERMGEIIVFKQGEDESLYNAWERYKKLLKRCPMYEIDQMTLMDIFCCGAFKRKSVEEVNHLIEDLVKSNYRAPFEASGSSSRLRGSGVIELNKMSAIEAKLDALMNKVSMQERRNQFTHLVGIVEDEQRVLNDKGLTHDGPYHVEEFQFVNGNRSYNFKPNTNFLTHYTLALRNHENFSYGPAVQQG